VKVERYRLLLGRRREERERRARMSRLVVSGLVPIPDQLLELPPAEQVDVATGMLFDRRRRTRGR
jgi:hypothetical protein